MPADQPSAIPAPPAAPRVPPRHPQTDELPPSQAYPPSIANLPPRIGLAEHLNQTTPVADDQGAVGADRRRRPDLVVGIEIPELLAMRAVDGVHVLDRRRRVEHPPGVERRRGVDRAVDRELPALGAA